MEVRDDVFHTSVSCLDCNKSIVWATTEAPVLNCPDPEFNDHFRCVSCCRFLGDDSTKVCLSCGAHYEAFSVWSEACSAQCGDQIDLAVERAQERSLAAEQAWLESYGEES